MFQRAYRLSLEIHRASLEFPRIEQFALADQVRRASKSICANLAEGFGRQQQSRPEFRRILIMAIVGGAIAPMLMGWIADKHGMQTGFIIPLFCFAAVMVYGLTWKRLFARDMGDTSKTDSMPAH